MHQSNLRQNVKRETLNYERMKENMKEFANELIAQCLHPDRIWRMTNNYNMEEMEHLEGEGNLLSVINIIQYIPNHI